VSYRIAEIFGFKADNGDPALWASRENRTCPFRHSQCTKASRTDPLGVCSIEQGAQKAIVCPVRFLEDRDIFARASYLAFGAGAPYTVVPEVPFLRTPEGRRVAKFDFVLVRHDGPAILDFCVLENQAVYFSGPEIRTEFREYMRSRAVPDPTQGRRPDYRSSSLKRLMPQLMIKVPWVRQRWGKYFFVATDAGFFGWMQGLQEQADITNSEVTWLIYELRHETGANLYRLTYVRPAFTLLSDSMASLTAGRALSRAEFEAELSRRLRRGARGGGRNA